MKIWEVDAQTIWVVLDFYADRFADSKDGLDRYIGFRLRESADQLAKDSE